jgi:23S rRNA pseudouridine2605 synthase
MYNPLVMRERLQKLLAQSGFGSRRDCDTLVAAGRVRVNGQVAVIGQKADPLLDKITVDGRLAVPLKNFTYVALYKPRGVLSTAEGDSSDSRQTVRDLVPVEGHLYPVGRLDVDSEGLILLTNDGDLTNRLTHPRYGHEKEYRVLVARHPDQEQLGTWRKGVVLEDGYKTAAANIRIEAEAGKGTWLRVVLREGRKRQIREMGSRTGLPVVRIIRVRIGTLTLDRLKPREWRYLTPQEVSELKGKSQRVEEHLESANRHSRRSGSHSGMAKRQKNR